MSGVGVAGSGCPALGAHARASVNVGSLAVGTAGVFALGDVHVHGRRERRSGTSGRRVVPVTPRDRCRGHLAREPCDGVVVAPPGGVTQVVRTSSCGSRAGARGHVRVRSHVGRVRRRVDPLESHRPGFPRRWRSRGVGERHAERRVAVPVPGLEPPSRLCVAVEERGDELRVVRLVHALASTRWMSRTRRRTRSESAPVIIVRITTEMISSTSVRPASEPCRAGLP